MDHLRHSSPCPARLTLQLLDPLVCGEAVLSPHGYCCLGCHCPAALPSAQRCPFVTATLGLSMGTLSNCGGKELNCALLICQEF